LPKAAGKQLMWRKKVMFNFIYEFLARVGYTHPIHPTEVHMPIGLVVGALIFACIAAIFKRRTLEPTARYCIILAFIWLFPTMLFGYMDWQHYYSGAWLFPIMVKLTLAVILAALLLIAIFIGQKKGADSKAALAVYSLCFLVVVAIGYYGGELTYGSKTTATPAEYTTGEKIFTANCSACHPKGANAIMPNLPLVGSSRLADFDTFLAFVRDPKLPHGKSGPMPAIIPSKLSDKQLNELYDYIVKELAKGAK
jgi:uncharacterized membrane protein